nr:immunoglobulin heavy chain junction region [Macaca mulatta]
CVNRPVLGFYYFDYW